MQGATAAQGGTFGEEAAMKPRTTYVGSAMTITFTTVCHIGHQAITTMYKSIRQRREDSQVAREAVLPRGNASVCAVRPGDQI